MKLQIKLSMWRRLAVLFGKPITIQMDADAVKPTINDKGELEINPITFGNIDYSDMKKKHDVCSHCGHSRAEHDCEYVYCNGMCHHDRYTDNECLCMEFKE